MLSSAENTKIDHFWHFESNYKSNDRKCQKLGVSMKQYLFEHFNSKGNHCFLNKISIIFFDKTDPSELLKRENYWQSTLKSMAPWGLNVEDSL